MGCREIGTPLLLNPAMNRIGTMNKNLVNNYRLGGYLLIAIGLINLRYQTSQSNVSGKSLSIIAPGTVLLISTWIPGAKKVLDLTATKIISLVIGLALIAYAVII